MPGRPKKSTTAAGSSEATTQVRQSEKQALENLKKIDHIVVLVLENRSFDQVLGYLSLPASKKGRGRRDVDGLTGDEFNLEPGDLPPDQADNAGTPHDPRIRRVFRLPRTVFPVDPGHSAGSVRTQLGGNDLDPPMGGFVRNFIEVLASEETRPLPKPGDIMGYYTGDQVPTYDLLGEHFAVCDRWFSSMPGPTWPNRMFLYCGTSNGIIKNPGSIVNYPPEYDTMPERLIIHVLDKYDVKWRIYSHDFAWMRFFRSFDPGPIPALSRVDKFAKFLKACEDGKLPAVSFIDPNWIDIGGGPGTSDDHPPADIAGGQRLVATVYEGLRTGKNRLLEKTLLIVTYDEHGGFYDHVLPPAAPDYKASRSSVLKTYGVRVPALVVSAWVPKRSACHTLFDHTSILKTILLRFANQTAINSMGRRVAAANHLGELLSLDRPQTGLRPAPARALAARQKQALTRIAVEPGRPTDLAVLVTEARAHFLARGVPVEHL